MDAVGSNIRVDARGREVMRILPRSNDGVNEEWSGRPVALRLGRAAAAAAGPALPARRAAGWCRQLERRLRGDRGGGRGQARGGAGRRPGVDRGGVRAEGAGGAPWGGTVECRTDGAALPAGNRSGMPGTATIADIDAAERILLVGTNPRVEAPVLNARLRKAWLRGAAITVVGEAVDLTYDYEHFGPGREALERLAGNAARRRAEGSADAGDRRSGRAGRRRRRGGARAGDEALRGVAVAAPACCTRRRHGWARWISAA